MSLNKNVISCMCEHAVEEFGSSGNPDCSSTHLQLPLEFNSQGILNVCHKIFVVNLINFHNSYNYYLFDVILTSILLHETNTYA